MIVSYNHHDESLLRRDVLYKSLFRLALHLWVLTCLILSSSRLHRVSVTKFRRLR